MYRALFAAVVFLTLGQSAFAQYSEANPHQNHQNQVRLIFEVLQLKEDAAKYYAKKNKKLACLTIQQAYEVEIKSGSFNSSTRSDIRKYCG